MAFYLEDRHCIGLIEPVGNGLKRDVIASGAFERVVWRARGGGGIVNMDVSVKGTKACRAQVACCAEKRNGINSGPGASSCGGAESGQTGERGVGVGVTGI